MQLDLPQVGLIGTSQLNFQAVVGYQVRQIPSFASVFLQGLASVLGCLQS